MWRRRRIRRFRRSWIRRRAWRRARRRARRRWTRRRLRRWTRRPTRRPRRRTGWWRREIRFITAHAAIALRVHETSRAVRQRLDASTRQKPNRTRQRDASSSSPHPALDASPAPRSPAPTHLYQYLWTRHANLPASRSSHRTARALLSIYVSALAVAETNNHRDIHPHRSHRPIVSSPDPTTTERLSTRRVPRDDAPSQPSPPPQRAHILSRCVPTTLPEKPSPTPLVALHEDYESFVREERQGMDKGARRSRVRRAFVSLASSSRASSSIHSSRIFFGTCTLLTAHAPRVSLSRLSRAGGPGDPGRRVARV